MSPLDMLRWPRRPRTDVTPAAMPEAPETQPAPRPAPKAGHRCHPHPGACWDPSCPDRTCRHCGQPIAAGIAHNCPDRQPTVHPQCAAHAAAICEACREPCGYQHPTPAHPTPGASA
jgi:hypothetical protein